MKSTSKDISLDLNLLSLQMNFGAHKPSGIKIEWLRGNNLFQIIDKKGIRRHNLG